MNYVLRGEVVGGYDDINLAKLMVTLCSKDSS